MHKVDCTVFNLHLDDNLWIELMEVIEYRGQPVCPGAFRRRNNDLSNEGCGLRFKAEFNRQHLPLHPPGTLQYAGTCVRQLHPATCPYEEWCAKTLFHG